VGPLSGDKVEEKEKNEKWAPQVDGWDGGEI
jgi:hypothetical protein